MEINEKFWKFVQENADSDPARLRLKCHGKSSPGFDVEFAITQIECRRKFRKKLSETLSANPHFLFPSVLAGEQSTSDLLARYHASLVEGAAAVVDLTAGLGIDVRHFVSVADKVVAVELDGLRAEILRCNFYGDSRVTVVEGDCRDYISQSVSENLCDKVDVAFIDPARRADDGSRIFALSQCQPDVIAMLPDLARFTCRLVIKMSPMFDVAMALSELRDVVRIVALGTPTECRELIAVVEFGCGGNVEPVIEALTVSSDETVGFDFTLSEEADATIDFGVPKPGDFIYEPFPSVMKAAPYRLFGQRFGLKALSANSHVYFGQSVVAKIPAQPLRVVEVLPYASAVIKRFKKKYPRVEISCRNFDVAPELLRRKLGVADGGDLRLIATKDSAQNPLLILTEKLR